MQRKLFLEPRSKPFRICAAPRVASRKILRADPSRNDMTRALTFTQSNSTVATSWPERQSAQPVYSLENPNLDLLRSTAVLLVVITHLAIFFQLRGVEYITNRLGHFGVIMFFVHTSFVLMLSLQKQQERSPGGNIFGRFLLRRLFRIAPLATIVILTIVFLRLPVAHIENGHFHGIPITPSGVISNLLFVQNITRTENIEAPLWSLPFEMQMYLVLPLLFLSVRRLSSELTLLGCWIAIALLCRVLTPADYSGWIEMLNYVPCFLAGVGAYGMIRTPHRMWPFAIFPATLFMCCLYYGLRSSIPGSWVCCFAMALAISRCSDMGSGVFPKACHLIARYSYGIYLTHFVCIWIAFEVLGSFPLLDRVLAFLVLATALPVALYHLVEAPMIAWGSRVTQSTSQCVISVRHLPQADNLL
jgi:peptidoglycan/LPS O-acetylase OafA/YrhL